MTNLQKLKMLVREAKHSYLVASSMTGHPDLSKILLKWADVNDSLITFQEGDGSVDDVIKDISPIIYIPILAVAESYCEILKQKKCSEAYIIGNNIDLVKDQFDSLKPVVSKNKLIDLINELCPAMEENGFAVSTVSAIGATNVAVN